MLGSFSKIANGNIAPAVFVKLDTSDGGRVLTCGANGNVFGISSPHVRRLALSGWDDGFAAIAGENLNVIGPGDDEALLQLGGTVAIGDQLKSDGSGFGVAGNSDKDQVGAIALAAGASGDMIRVKPVRYDKSV